jgi:hypothetical protein
MRGLFSMLFGASADGIMGGMVGQSSSGESQFVTIASPDLGSGECDAHKLLN